jgi:hypothetical protein
MSEKPPVKSGCHWFFGTSHVRPLSGNVTRGAPHVLVEFDFALPTRSFECIDESWAYDWIEGT